MQDHTSVYRAELAAIILALNWIDQLPALHTGAVILSDSLSALQCIKLQKEFFFYCRNINLMYTFML